eukprot:GHVQ01022657.1.p1 GENE.GHVQ01022657.1~~GHVQ01022657.1.p1  ORF type:complete len:1586 (-),score=237.22 GHVQ01022657.1:2210-6967(-)
MARQALEQSWRMLCEGREVQKEVLPFLQSSLAFFVTAEGRDTYWRWTERRDGPCEADVDKWEDQRDSDVVLGERPENIGNEENLGGCLVLPELCDITSLDVKEQDHVKCLWMLYGLLVMYTWYARFRNEDENKSRFEKGPDKLFRALSLSRDSETTDSVPVSSARTAQHSSPRDSEVPGNGELSAEQQLPKVLCAAEFVLISMSERLMCLCGISQWPATLVDGSIDTVGSKFASEYFDSACNPATHRRPVSDAEAVDVGKGRPECWAKGRDLLRVESVVTATEAGDIRLSDDVRLAGAGEGRTIEVKHSFFAVAAMKQMGHLTSKLAGEISAATRKTLSDDDTMGVAAGDGDEGQTCRRRSQAAAEGVVDSSRQELHEKNALPAAVEILLDSFGYSNPLSIRLEKDKFRVVEKLMYICLSRCSVNGPAACSSQCNVPVNETGPPISFDSGEDSQGATTGDEVILSNMANHWQWLVDLFELLLGIHSFQVPSPVKSVHQREAKSTKKRYQSQRRNVTAKSLCEWDWDSDEVSASDDGTNDEYLEDTAGNWGCSLDSVEDSVDGRVLADGRQVATTAAEGLMESLNECSMRQCLCWYRILDVAYMWLRDNQYIDSACLLRIVFLVGLKEIVAAAYQQGMDILIFEGYATTARGAEVCLLGLENEEGISKHQALDSYDVGCFVRILMTAFSLCAGALYKSRLCNCISPGHPEYQKRGVEPVLLMWSAWLCSCSNCFVYKSARPMYKSSCCVQCISMDASSLPVKQQRNCRFCSAGEDWHDRTSGTTDVFSSSDDGSADERRTDSRWYNSETKMTGTDFRLCNGKPSTRDDSLSLGSRSLVTTSAMDYSGRSQALLYVNETRTTPTCESARPFPVSPVYRLFHSLLCPSQAIKVFASVDPTIVASLLPSFLRTSVSAYFSQSERWHAIESSVSLRQSRRTATRAVLGLERKKEPLRVGIDHENDEQSSLLKWTTDSSVPRTVDTAWTCLRSDSLTTTTELGGSGPPSISNMFNAESRPASGNVADSLESLRLSLGAVLPRKGIPPLLSTEDKPASKTKEPSSLSLVVNSSSLVSAADSLLESSGIHESTEFDWFSHFEGWEPSRPSTDSSGSTLGTVVGAKAGTPAAKIKAVAPVINTDILPGAAPSLVPPDVKSITELSAASSESDGLRPWCHAQSAQELSVHRRSSVRSSDKSGTLSPLQGLTSGNEAKIPRSSVGQPSAAARAPSLLASSFTSLSLFPSVSESLPCAPLLVPTRSCTLSASSPALRSIRCGDASSSSCLSSSKLRESVCLPSPLSGSIFETSAQTDRATYLPAVRCGVVPTSLDGSDDLEPRDWFSELDQTGGSVCTPCLGELSASNNLHRRTEQLLSTNARPHVPDSSSLTSVASASSVHVFSTPHLQSVSSSQIAWSSCSSVRSHSLSSTAAARLFPVLVAASSKTSDSLSNSLEHVTEPSTSQPQTTTTLSFIPSLLSSIASVLPTSCHAPSDTYTDTRSTLSVAARDTHLFPVLVNSLSADSDSVCASVVPPPAPPSTGSVADSRRDVPRLPVGDSSAVHGSFGTWSKNEARQAKEVDELDELMSFLNDSSL